MSKYKELSLTILVVVLLAASAILARAAPQVGNPSAATNYSIPWWSVDNGGGVSQGGMYQLRGTIGQPDASTSSGGSYTLRGGFWSGSFTYSIFAPLIVR